MTNSRLGLGFDKSVQCILRPSSVVQPALIIRGRKGAFQFHFKSCVYKSLVSDKTKSILLNTIGSSMYGGYFRRRAVKKFVDACRNGDVPMARQLIDEGVDINGKYDDRT